MYKRGILILILFFALFSIVATSAQEETTNDTDTNNTDITTEVDTETGVEVDAEVESDIISEVESEYQDAELGAEAGTTPDSALYFIDEFFDRFGDDLNVREERIAEIKEMIQQGKVEEAREALNSYLALAEKLETESDPDRRDDTRRSAVAIRNAVNELESEIPEEFREEFVAGVLESEEGIITAAEISSKIKELCEELSKIDPMEYSRVCLTGEDSPNWHKKLDKRLTEGQRQEAKLFGDIMSQCFRTAGQECRCEEIPFQEFAEMCSIAAPLATACEIEGDEEACEQMDNLEMPELPEHLQDIMDSLENDVSGSQIDLHMPRECREAGATSPKECMKIMIQTNAPEECRDALLEANPQNEREARKICEKIMFEQNAPEECIEKGLTNPRECGKLMFQLNAPQECLDAGLTGETRGDEKKCREIMDAQGRGEGREGFRGPGGGFGGGNCQGIQDQMERLKCYDGASQGAQEHRENFESRFRETQDAQRQCAEKCLSQGSAWDFSNGQCNCRASERFDDSQFRDQFREEQQPPPEFQQQPPPEFQQPPSEFTQPPTESSGTTSGEGTTTQTESTTTSESSGTSSSSGEGSGSITGSVISGNGFLDYYFK